MRRTNQSYARRCSKLMEAINVMSAIGVVVRKVDVEATPVPVLWVFTSPALYRNQGNAIGSITDLGRSRDARTKTAECLGCEVRWLEPLGFAMARTPKRLNTSTLSRG